MPHALSSYAVRLLKSETDLLAALTVPLLVWESASISEVTVMPTLSGAAHQKPGAGESIVFELKKSGTGGVNPFAMGITVGRTAANDVVLPDPSISRFHAYFQQDGRTGQWKLVDAESRNGSWMGPLKLVPNAGVVVTDGARLRFGDVELRFCIPESFIEFLKRRMDE